LFKIKDSLEITLGKQAVTLCILERCLFLNIHIKIDMHIDS